MNKTITLLALAIGLEYSYKDHPLPEDANGECKQYGEAYSAICSTRDKSCREDQLKISSFNPGDTIIIKSAGGIVIMNAITHFRAVSDRGIYHNPKFEDLNHLTVCKK